MTYNWQQSNWPRFQYQTIDIEDLLLKFAERSGKISGLLEGLTEADQTKAMIRTMISEAMKSSEIEGEFLNRNDVASSIRRNLGLDLQISPAKDKRAQGIAELMLAVRNTFSEVLSEEMLFNWHRMLMKGKDNMQLGAWRTGTAPMQIVSGAIGKEKVHFEAPPSALVPKEMARFIKWFNETSPSASGEIRKPAVRAAIAHLYFESIHPFEDGNGRLGRALAEKALSQGLRRPVLISISKEIEGKKSKYYEALKLAQCSNEISPWIRYFVQTTLDAQRTAEKEIELTLKKTRFFDLHKAELNKRQLKIINRMLAEGPEGFEGGMSTRKYISLTRTSKATATRDLQDLVLRKILKPSGGGRSTSYDLNFYT